MGHGLSRGAASCITEGEGPLTPVIVHNRLMENTYCVGGLLEGSSLRLEPFSITIGEGRIMSLRRGGDAGPWNRCIAVPGLIQAHLHLGQTLFRGMAENQRLLPWLEERIWPLEASHSPDTLATSVIVSLRELLASGCTALLDMGTVELSEVTVDLLRLSGIRAVACNSLMDEGPAWIARNLNWLVEESARTRSLCGDLVEYGYAPRFALSCSEALWAWLASDRSVRGRTTHAAESSEEMEHPAIASAGGNIHFLRRRGFTGPGTLLAHCVHLAEGENTILRTSGTTVVHCPWTNLRLGSGIADVPSLVSGGVRVCVASDGAACNNRLDLAGDLRLAMSLSAVKGAPGRLEGKHWLESVTTRAAEALGFDGVGRLSPGWSADMVLIEPTGQEWDEFAASEDPVRSVLELDWPARVRLTMVAGRVLYENGEYPALPSLPVSVTEARSAVSARAGLLSSPGSP
jgi:5-methylthioadenosine/S-adenosylhomocysteine deaminase